MAMPQAIQRLADEAESLQQQVYAGEPTAEAEAVAPVPQPEVAEPPAIPDNGGVF